MFSDGERLLLKEKYEIGRGKRDGGSHDDLNMRYGNHNG
jgi:hypothetical protein